MVLRFECDWFTESGATFLDQSENEVHGGELINVKLELGVKLQQSSPRLISTPLIEICSSSLFIYWPH